VVAGVVTLLVVTGSQAQQPGAPARFHVPGFVALPAEQGARPQWLATLSSALVPGTGQLLLRQDHAVIYLIAEAFFLYRFISLSDKAGSDEARYRDLAFRVARASFGPVQSDTVFEYFEQMGVYVESGAFDTEPGPALVPPTDESSYNGRIWSLARKTYFSNPESPPDTATSEYRTALEFYRRRAVGPNFQWSWRTSPFEQDLYRQSIAQGDEAFRRASTHLGLLLANHFLSMVDAFVSQRLAGRGAPVELDHRLRSGAPGSFQLEFGLRISH
jgi:hypothetical protein